MKNYRQKIVGKKFDKNKLIWLNLISIIIILGTFQTATAASFTPLGDLPGGSFRSFAGGVSSNGIVAGTSSSIFVVEAFEWAGGSIQGLGTLPTTHNPFSGAQDISSDGTTIVGSTTSDELGAQAYLWTSGGGMQGLGQLEVGRGSFAIAVSSDGSVVVGNANIQDGTEAFRWAGGMIGLGDMRSEGTTDSRATGVSADGSVVVGLASSDNGAEAFRWTSGGGMMGLGDLDGGDFSSQARAVSSDGSIVVGFSSTDIGLEPFIWTSGGGMVKLDNPGDIFILSIDGISTDGSIIVGQSFIDGVSVASVWDSTNGMRNLNTVLTDAGVELGDYTLTIALDVSDDGTKIVGNANGPFGPEAFMVELPLVNLPQADLSVTKTDSVDPVLAGEQLTYTIAVTNNGPGEAQNVQVIDTLPIGVTFVSTNGCIEDPNGVPTCSLGSIASGDFAEFTVTVNVNEDTIGTITNPVSATSDTNDPNSANNSVQEDTVVTALVPMADLGIAKISLTDTVQPGDTFEYLLQVENSGPDDDTNVIVQDTLMGPGVFTGIDNGNCTIQNNQEFTCTFDNMASGFLVFIEASVDVNGDAPEGPVFENSFNISGDLEDPNQDNNSGMLSSPVVETSTPPIIKFFNEIVGIVQTFSIQVLQEITNSFNENIDILQTFSVKILQPTPSSSSQQVQILQTFSVVKNPIEVVSIEQLLVDIDSSDLSDGIKNALQNPLQSIDSNFDSLEFSATSQVTSSKSPTNDSNSNEQINEVCGKLGAFINKVNALSGKKINPEDALSFIDSAEQIKETFGCNSITSSESVSASSDISINDTSVDTSDNSNQTDKTSQTILEDDFDVLTDTTNVDTTTNDNTPSDTQLVQTDIVTADGSDGQTDDTSFDTVTSDNTTPDNLKMQRGMVTDDSDVILDTASFSTVTKDSSSPSPQTSDDITDDKKGGGGDEHLTRPTFGLSHETFETIVDSGFRFNDQSFTINDNFHTPFAQQTVNIGEINSFEAKIYADKRLKVQEFLFGIPNVGEAHLAELGVEVWYDYNGEIEEIKAIQKSNVIDKETIVATHEKTKCQASDIEQKCDVTNVSMIFLEPLKDNVIAVKAIDYKGRYQITYLNEGVEIAGESLNPMNTLRIPSTIRDEGLVQVTQTAKYSNYWVAEDGRIFEMNNFGSFKQIDQTFERFQDTGNPYTRVHSGFGGIIAYEQKRALDVFDSSEFISELPDSFAYLFPEAGDRMTEEMKAKMLEQEEIAKKILEESKVQARW